MWTYRCYADGTEPNLWRRWYDRHPDLQGSHDSIFEMIEQMDTWREPHAKLFDKANRIVELRFSGMVEYRLMGFFGKKRHEFVVLGTCYHKQKVYSPKGIRETVVKRKKKVEEDIRRAPPCDRPK